MPDLLPVTLADMLACIDRELKLRKAAYPRWVESGKISRSRADREIEVMAATREYIAAQIAAGGTG
jgi:hypothetical protein